MVFSIRAVRVSSLFAEVIHEIHSARALGVMPSQTVSAFDDFFSADSSCMGSATFTWSVVGEIENSAVSPTETLAPSRMAELIWM